MNRKYQTLGALITELGDRRTAFSKVRELARRWNKALIDQPCENCGYAKHVEVCHVKPVAAFKETDVLLAINGSHNIALLCPTCHWEFDAGHLSLDDFRIALD